MRGIVAPGTRRRAGSAALSLLLAGLLGGCAACTAFKRFAYEGIGRDRWQEPDLVVRLLDLRPGSRVADLGAGGGYFTFRLADAVGPAGTVYAVDIDDGLPRRTKTGETQTFRQVGAQCT